MPKIKNIIYPAILLSSISIGLYWVMTRYQITVNDFKSITELKTKWLVAIVLLSLLIYLLDSIRYYIFGLAFSLKMKWSTCLEASVTNFLFAWSSPGGVLSLPSTTYVLNKKGVPIESALLIVFGKSMTSGLILVLLSLIPIFGTDLLNADHKITNAVILISLGVYVGLLLIPVLGVVYPTYSKLLISKVCPQGLIQFQLKTSIDRAQALIKTEFLKFIIPIMVSHLMYLAVFIGVGACAAMAYEANSFMSSVAASTAYTAFAFSAPTPGGAGLAEATSVAFYGNSLLSTRNAVMAALTFRIFTFYAQIAVGVGYYSGRVVFDSCNAMRRMLSKSHRG